MTTSPCIRLAFEVGHLSRTPRTGWAVAGVPGDVESVAEHSHRTSLLAHVIAAAEGANPDRAATLGAWHDVPETRIGDIPHLGRQYLTATDPTVIIKDQTEGLPETVSAAIRGAIAEFEARQTAEAIAARDADKLDCLLRAREYQRAGASDVGTWIESSLARLTTTTAVDLAHDAIAGDPGTWWRSITVPQARISGEPASDTEHKSQPCSSA